MAFARWSYDALLVPPLQLTPADSGQGDHVTRCELSLHLGCILFETKELKNV
jgi:hypothetical protein